MRHAVSSALNLTTQTDEGKVLQCIYDLRTELSLENHPSSQSARRTARGWPKS
jgi:hypothetical protein